MTTSCCPRRDVVQREDKSPVYLTPENSCYETPVNGDVLEANWTV